LKKARSLADEEKTRYITGTRYSKQGKLISLLRQAGTVCGNCRMHQAEPDAAKLQKMPGPVEKEPLSASPAVSAYRDRKAMNTLQKKIHNHIFPRWAADCRAGALACSFVSCAAGIMSVLLQHGRDPLLAVYVWHGGLVALMPCILFYLKGTYRKYLDAAWDAYY